MIKAFRQLWVEESGQDVAEYAVMLAVILVIVIGTVRLIGGNANNVFSQVGSSIAAIIRKTKPRCVWQRASPDFFCQFSPARLPQ